MKLRARKALTYATRRLQPGDVFEARSRRDHKLLLATRKVEAVRDEVPVQPPPPAVAAKIAAAVAPAPAPEPEAPASTDLAALRAEYEAVVGRRPFMGWGADELRNKMAAIKQGVGS